MKDKAIWWQGPAYLVESDSNVPELKVHTAQISSKFLDFSKYSKLKIFQRIFAYVYRFIFNCRNPNDKFCGVQQSDELNKSFIYLCKISQADSFCKELKILQKQLTLTQNSLITSVLYCSK